MFKAVAALDLVRLPLQSLLALTGRLRVRAGGDEIVPTDHLAADEPARNVGVDRRGGVEGPAPAAATPRARLLLARREERDEVELVEEPLRDLAERGLPLAEVRRLV